MYIDYHNIKFIQTELTSRCPIQCPQCYRQTHKEFMQNVDFSMDIFDNVFTSELCQQLDYLTIIGNTGDSTAAPLFLEQFKLLKERGLNSIVFHTHGSSRPISWWQDLAAISTKDRVIFALDGLEDTNHIYRVGTQWQKIMDNANAYIKNGGIADWRFLIFEHNIHQIEEARHLANEMGFSKFVVEFNHEFLPNYYKFDYQNTRPDLEKYLSDEHLKLLKDYKKIYENETYTTMTKINCKWKKDQGIYIDVFGSVWPCCWSGEPLFVSPNSYKRTEYDLLKEKYGASFNSLKHNTLQEILQHQWFKSDLEKSWEDSSRLSCCGKKCGEVDLKVGP